MIESIIKNLPVEVDSFEKLNFVGDSGVGYYKILTKGKSLFLKIYNKSRKNDYLLELSNYNIINNNLHNLPKKHLFNETDIYCYILYDFIDGGSLYYKNNKGIKDKNFYLKIIKDIANLQGIVTCDIKSINTVDWFRKEFINNIQAGTKLKKEIMDLYESIDPSIQSVVNEFNGIYFDRNPRNILFNDNDKIYHIDFEVLWFVSPIFDLVKLLRNGIDYREFSTKNISSYNLFDEVEEAEFFNFFIKKLSKKNPNLLNSLKTDPKALAVKYNLICLFVHLLYVAYCSAELKKEESIVKRNRQKYHMSSSVDVLKKIILEKESLSYLNIDFDRINNFLNFLLKVKIQKNGSLIKID